MLVLFGHWLTQLPSWERSYTATQELMRLIPGLEKKINEGEPEEIAEFYAEVRSIILFIDAFTY